jgi:hypothetical protein
MQLIHYYIGFPVIIAVLVIIAILVIIRVA